MHCPTIGHLSQLPVPVAEYHYFRILSYTTHRWRRFPSGRSGGARWNWKTDVGVRRGEDYETDDYDDEDKFGFTRGAKQRIWWPENSFEEDDDADEGFRNMEYSINFNSIFKIFQAFGWVIPAVIISLLFGREHDHSMIMTLALPLSQTVFSLVADALWGRRKDRLRPKTKSRKRKRNFSRSIPKAWVRNGKEVDSRSGKRSGDPRSWMADYKASAKYEKPNTQNFGGWDELDNHVKVSKTPHDPPV